MFLPLVYFYTKQGSLFFDEFLFSSKICEKPSTLIVLPLQDFLASILNGAADDFR
jgi:hypothetical protein